MRVWTRLRQHWAAAAASRAFVTAALLLVVWGATHGLVWLLPSVFEPLQGQAIDQLFRLRSHAAFLKPAYDGTVVEVPIDDESIRARESFYLDRSDLGEFARALERAGVAAQFYDVIFAAPESDEGDRALADAFAAAGNAYVGMALGITTDIGGDAGAVTAFARHDVPERARWRLVERGGVEALPRPRVHFVTLPALESPSRGMGFLDVVPDADGVIRRVALVAREGEAYLPSLPLVVLADYFGVPPERIEIEPGRQLVLHGARRPGSTGAEDIAIPIDWRGFTVVNYLGPWGSMTAVPFATIWEASGDRFMMEDLREELQGKIAVVSWFGTGLSDISPVPTDRQFPRSGIWANVMNMVLTGEFLRELGVWGMLVLVELPLVALLLVAGQRLTTIPFLAVAVGLLVGYLGVVSAAFLGAGFILAVPGPLLGLVGSAGGIAAYQYHLESEARAKLHRELAVARDIQLGTLPRTMPAIAGYDIAGTSRPADQTGGDSFDVVPSGADRFVLLLGDATGHGIGPALSVTQVRSMLRVALRLGAGLEAIVTHLNDQLSDDLAANRFVTAFLGILDSAGHRVTYHSAGQGPLLHLHAATGECDLLGASGLALGMMSGLPVKPPRTLTLEPGDVLGLMTDGIFEQENARGEAFGEAPVIEILRNARDRPMAECVETLYRTLDVFRGKAPQADDVTLLLVRRLAAPVEGGR